MKKQLGGRIYTIPDNRMGNLQKVLGENFNYIRSKYVLIVYGDSGRPTIIEKVLQRVVVDTLGKVKEDVHIDIILDEDGTEYGDLKKIVSSKLRFISKDKTKFNILPSIKIHGESFILTHPKGRGNIEVRLRTVPQCLELQIAKKAIEIKHTREEKIWEKGPHGAIDILVSKYYEGNEESLIRESVGWLNNEEWVEGIKERLTN